MSRHRLHADQLAGSVGDDPRVLPEPHFAARLGHRRKLDVRRRQPLARLFVVVLKNLRAEVGANELGEPAADHFIRVEPEHFQRLRINEPEIPLGVGFEDDVGGRVEQVAVSIFGGLQPLLDRFARGDVAVVDDDAADPRLLEQVTSHALGPADAAVPVAAAESSVRGSRRIVKQARDQRLPRVAIHRLDQSRASPPDILVR